MRLNESGWRRAMLRCLPLVVAAALVGASNLRQQTWTEFAARVRPDRAFQESISDPVIDIDDGIAMVWAPFVVRVGGKVSNCGVDHFDLVREHGTWKVMNLTFSSRTPRCPGQ